MTKPRALFLDRDGVINLDVGYAYHPNQIEFVPGIFEFCEKFQAAKYLLIVVTNQSGIGRGYYTESQFLHLSKWMADQFEQHNVFLKRTYYCPHHPVHAKGKYLQKCGCRKPAPGLIIEAINDYNIDPNTSIFIGDKESDMQAANSAGIVNRIFLGTTNSDSEATIELANLQDLQVVEHLLVPFNSTNQS